MNDRRVPTVGFLLVGLTHTFRPSTALRLPAVAGVASPASMLKTLAEPALSPLTAVKLSSSPATGRGTATEILLAAARSSTRALALAALAGTVNCGTTAIRRSPDRDAKVPMAQ